MNHIPVLLHEVLALFEGSLLKVFFEGTVGAGGHAKAILQAHPEIETYFACDRDPSALKLAQKTLEPWEKKIRWVHGPFAEMGRYLDGAKVTEVDGVLLDIGVSSMQLDQGERGFSFRVDAPLDMRMDPSSEKTAEIIVNEFPEEKLADIFYEYGEEFRSRAAAKAIVKGRKRKRIKTTQELVEIVEPVLRKGKIHPATKIFQALRIAVNDELDQLKEALKIGMERLSMDGLFAVISFHSLEDRIVKWAFKEAEHCEMVTKKPITATQDEIRKNPRSRSAKLRGAKRVE
jgi:16S rRNA (cytosine1402-N4)-methyltransferase